ncbi:MAG: PAS domain-containing protein [Phycisphaeraceae bacterium]|nr:PAS domain-containing protein [Phycisphaeraceae bacterium]
MQSLGSRESRKSKALKIVVVVGVLFIIARTALDTFDGTVSFAQAWKILLDPVVLIMILLSPYLFQLIVKPLREMDERQRRMDQALDHEQKNLKAIFGASPVGMMLLDESLTIQKANQAMGRMLGAEVPDLLNQLLSVAMGCEKAGADLTGACLRCDRSHTCAIFTAVSSVLKTRDAVHGLEVELDRPADETLSGLWLLISVIPIETLGKLQVLVSMQDITSRCEQEGRIKEARDQAEQAKLDLERTAECAKVLADEAVAANVAKSQFLSNMSHEIRTPMNSIVGFSDVLMDESMTPRQHQYVGVIQKSSEHPLELINDILDLSKIEANKLVIEKIECAPRDLLKDLEHTFEEECGNRQLEFNVVCAEDVPDMIVSDPTRLRQCLFNMVSNAIKFTEQGHVHVAISFIPESDEPVVRIDVEDTGIGIALNKQEQVFKAFTQADPETTRKYGGTGLGLTITKRLVELLGGKMSCQSELGKGATFSILLPANDCCSPDNGPDPETSLVTLRHGGEPSYDSATDDVSDVEC